MNTIAYLKERYGCGVPIFLKDIRIGGKSKTAIKQALYRANKNGEIQKETNGLYFFPRDDMFSSGIYFDDYLRVKYICDDRAGPCAELFNTVGYYSGLTFLNMFGLSEQVPAVIEITTNNTASKKREIEINGRRAILRKAKTKVTYQNYKTLQFLDMIALLSKEEILASKEKLFSYAKTLPPKDVTTYMGLYGTQTMKKLVETGLLYVVS